MVTRFLKWFSIILVFSAIVLLSMNITVNAESLSQQPTVLISTVTGTPVGVMAVVRLDQENQINVRSGPGVFFDNVGVLLPGQKVPALGRTAGGDWILVQYPGTQGGSGWIYAPLVSLTSGTLSIIEPPSTPTPAITQTIDPTLAAQFIQTPIPTRLPTFTPAPPVIIPTFTDYSGSTPGLIPVGLIIIVLIGLGLLIGLFIYIQGR